MKNILILWILKNKMIFMKLIHGILYWKIWRDVILEILSKIKR
jgi:hypothetical protein